MIDQQTLLPVGGRWLVCTLLVLPVYKLIVTLRDIHTVLAMTSLSFYSLLVSDVFDS